MRLAWVVVNENLVRGYWRQAALPVATIRRSRWQGGFPWRFLVEVEGQRLDSFHSLESAQLAAERAYAASRKRS